MEWDHCLGCLYWDQSSKSDLMSCLTEAECSSLPAFNMKLYYPEHTSAYTGSVSQGLLEASQRFPEVLKSSQTLSVSHSISELLIAPKSL